MSEKPALLAEIHRIYSEAERLYSQNEVEAAYDRMAVAITTRLSEHNPLLLSVVIGGMIPTAALMSRLDFPLQLDYVHATRYGEHTRGGELKWLKAPSDLSGRSVLIIDDILDEGHTLREIITACHEAGATEVLTAVLIDKQVERSDGLQQADFTGLSIPDRYVFGCGMDYKGYLRNLSGIYAVKGT